jgi:hypothetical protein
MRAHVAVSIAILASLAGATAAGAQERDVRTNWSLHPLTLRQPMTDAKTMPVWIGVRNERRGPQMVCMSTHGYILGNLEDPYVVASGGGPHACRDDVQFTIVLPGETYFHVILMNLRKDWQTGPLELSLILEDFDDSGKPHSSLMKWNGNVPALVAAGEKLNPKRQQR